jgi:hypothetical protein
MKQQNNQIQIQIGSGKTTTHKFQSSQQSLSHLIPDLHTQYQWVGTGDRVEPEEPIWKAQEKYGSVHWKWMKFEKKEGGEATTPGMWINFILGLILWSILLFTGFMPFISAYYQVAVERVFALIDRGLVWWLGPEDPFLYIVRRIVVLLGNVVGFIMLLAVVWYLTAVWCFLPYKWVWGECQANYMRRFFGGVIATLFIVSFYGWGIGNTVIESLRSLQPMPIIGPLMNMMANILQKIYNFFRTPHWAPITGSFISSYFPTVRGLMPYLSRAMEPVEMATQDMKEFLRSTKEMPVVDLTRKFKMDEIFDKASYQYMDDEEKQKEFYDRNQKMTSRFMQWFVITMAGVFGGVLNVFRKISSSTKERELKAKLSKIKSDKGMDANTKKTEIQKIQYEIQQTKLFPQINEQGLINTIETGTLAGHFTLFWGLIVFIIFCFFKPPAAR